MVMKPYVVCDFFTCGAHGEERLQWWKEFVAKETIAILHDGLQTCADTCL